MIGVLTNSAAVIVGSIIGLLLNKGIPEKVSQALMKCVGLATVYIAVTGIVDDKAETMIVVLSICIGGLIGTLINIDKWLNLAADKLGSKFKSPGKDHSFAEGFVSATLLFCVGAMTVMGSLQSALTGDNSTVFTKSILDFISAVIFASTLGIGVMFSSLSVFVIQGALVLSAGFIAPYMSDFVIGNVTATGSLVIFALSINLLGIGKIKVANLLPAVLLPLALCPLWNLF